MGTLSRVEAYCDTYLRRPTSDTELLRVGMLSEKLHVLTQSALHFPFSILDSESVP